MIGQLACDSSIPNSDMTDNSYNFHYEKDLLQMEVSVVCTVMVTLLRKIEVVVWFGGEFYTSIRQWFATQLEPNDTLKKKLLCKNINFISWIIKFAF